MSYSARIYVTPCPSTRIEQRSRVSQTPLFSLRELRDLDARPVSPNDQTSFSECMVGNKQSELALRHHIQQTQSDPDFNHQGEDEFVEELLDGSPAATEKALDSGFMMCTLADNEEERQDTRVEVLFLIDPKLVKVRDDLITAFSCTKGESKNSVVKGEKLSMEDKFSRALAMYSIAGAVSYSTYFQSEKEKKEVKELSRCQDQLRDCETWLRDMKIWGPEGSNIIPQDWHLSEMTRDLDKADTYLRGWFHQRIMPDKSSSLLASLGAPTSVNDLVESRKHLNSQPFTTA